MRKIGNICSIIKLEGNINNTPRIIYFIFNSIYNQYDHNYIENGENFIVNSISDISDLHIFANSEKNKKYNLSEVSTPYQTGIYQMVLENSKNPGLIFHLEDYLEIYNLFKEEHNYSIILDMFEEKNKENTNLSIFIKKILESKYIQDNYSHLINEIKIYLRKIIRLNNSKTNIYPFLRDTAFLKYLVHYNFGIPDLLHNKITNILRWLNFIRKLYNDSKIQKIIIFGDDNLKTLEELLRNNNFKITFSTLNTDFLSNTNYILYEETIYRKHYIELEPNFTFSF